MVAVARGRIFRRKDGKYFMYLPKHLVEDSAFPFEVESSVRVSVVIDHQGRKLIITPITRDSSAMRRRSSKECSGHQVRQKLPGFGVHG